MRIFWLWGAVQSLAANNQWMSANTGVEFTMRSSEPAA